MQSLSPASPAFLEKSEISVLHFLEKSWGFWDQKAKLYIRVCHQMLSPKKNNLQLLNSEDIGPKQGSRTIFLISCIGRKVVLT